MPNSPPIETDLSVIAKRAEPDWADNWNFRAYLQQDVDPPTLDQTAQTVNAAVSVEIDCTTCGNCCREVYPYMTPADVERLALGMGTSKKEILSRTKTEDGGIVFCEKPCPMLRENKCTVYDHRPDDCREYPHLDKPDFIGGSIGFIQNYGTCPIVYNVYSRLKSCFAYDANKDYIGDTDPENT
jgi:Fe-S-cluster containining protein